MEKIGIAFLAVLVLFLSVRIVDRSVANTPPRVTIVPKDETIRPQEYARQSPEIGGTRAPEERKPIFDLPVVVDATPASAVVIRENIPKMTITRNIPSVRPQAYLMDAPKISERKIAFARLERHLRKEPNFASDRGRADVATASSSSLLDSRGEGGCSSLTLPATSRTGKVNPDLRRLQRTIEAQGRLIDKYADLHGIDCRIVAAVMTIESQGEPRAVSSAGARGVMQIMPDTGRRLGYSPRELYDPEKSLDAGIRHILEGLEMTDDNLVRALAGYECGNKCGRRLRNPERQTYVKKVTPVLALMGFHLD